ncbi:MAG: S-layer homology domain-containing protein [Chloroflexota bacterium]|nr:S-layer homology domain-containing protein [Chloroflexota bacterium]MDQ5865033.1 S-layer homology domain-containing protein [Chloroflexota bacterium]
MSKKNLTYLATGIFSLLLFITALWSGLAQAAAPPATTGKTQPGTSNGACGPTWQRVSSPSGSTGDTVLFGVDAVSGGAAWAAGVDYSTETNSNPNGNETIVERWNGSEWSLSGQPITGGIPTSLWSVAAISDDDVWAVGGHFSRTTTPLARHWDGTDWSTAQLPRPENSFLYGTDGVASDDVWSVGVWWDRSAEHSHILHWDGQSWTETPSADGGDERLTAIDARTASDAWAVGSVDPWGNTPLIKRWNGTQWSNVPAPSMASGAHHVLRGVSALSETAAWAVGYYDVGNDDHKSLPLLMRWDGQTWTILNPPTYAATEDRGGELRDVVALAEDDVWVVGYYRSNYIGSQPLIWHWNGLEWSVVTTPSANGDYGELYGVAADPASGDVWAVGRSTEGSLVMRYHDPCSDATATSTATATATSTATATATATQCVLTFQQVSSPNLSESFSVLADIDALSSDDIWAVGTGPDANGPKLLIEHWDGTQWSFSGQDLAEGIPAELESVAAVAPDDVWAAGTLYYGSSGSPSTRRVALLLHWDGTEWNTVQVPLPADSVASSLTHIAASSADNIWAVGHSYNNGVRAISLHWDGTEWTLVPVAGAEGKLLKAVSVRAQDDVWAVGNTYPDVKAITMHWDGTEWKSVPVPDVGAEGSLLDGISILSADDAWAVGYYRSPLSSHGLPRAWAIHWDGQSWHNTTDLEDERTGYLYDVEALSPNDVWAAGIGSHWGPEGPVIMHWDGVAWSRVEGPNSPEKVEGIMALTSVSSWEIWGGGWSKTQNPYKYETLVVRTSTDTCNLPTRTPEGTATQTATPTSTPTADPCAPSMQRVVGSNQAANGTFYDVDPYASDDVWAVSTLAVERFDGSQWNVAYESSQSQDTWIHGIEVVAPDDVWASGRRIGNTGSPLVHWDGETWTEQSYPGMAIGDMFFTVEAVAPDDVWAAGTRNNKAALLHWDGRGWSEVAVPDLPGTVSNSGFVGLSASSTDDVWAVGSVRGKDLDNTAYSGALVAHWDGDSWSVANPTADLGFSAPDATLRAVHALSPDDVWAVGLYFGPSAQPLVMHWDGLTWSSVQVPKLPYADVTPLFDVVAVATDDVWMVGSTNGGDSIRDSQAFILHWNGAALEIVSGLTPNYDTDFPFAIDATRGKPGEIWMVGEEYKRGSHKTLALRLSRPCVVARATATPSVTPNSTNAPTASPTATARQPESSPTAPGKTATTTATKATTATGTATTTACSLQFADLPDGSTFQPFALCLACKGILSGYRCGGHGEPCDGRNSPYFRPSSLVTRGQIAKIVANAVGLTGAPGAQLFEDVPPGAPFYSYVNRLAALGVMGGYACGGPDEPCGAGNLPYFRPDNNATRGQIAKIVSNGAGYTESHTVQTFEDVPTTHTFYLPVERLASRAVMGGYDCGGPGEPCGPESLPYFRPGSNATRGQVAKIVSNTFFEGCAVR